MGYKLTDAITNEEYKMLDYYRQSYVSDNNLYSSYISTENLLKQGWVDAKQTLYKMFGEQLIISKEFEYIKEDDEIYAEMSDMTSDYKKYGRQGRSGTPFIIAFESWIDKNIHVDWSWDNDSIYFDKINMDSNTYYDLRSLVDTETLVKNEYKGSKFSIPLPDGKTYTVTPGTKAIRALSVIAKAYEIPGFEDFRICHSLIHNQKKIKGNLFLSIHPLDYWTMSDNNCGWESCMSWSGHGGYRQGTVEMMNSPWVVVAYINSDDKYLSIGDNR